MSASFSVCPKAVGQCRPSSPPPPSSASIPQQSPPLLAATHTLSSPPPGQTSRSTKLVEPRENPLHHPQASASTDNALRNSTTDPGNAYEYSHTKSPQTTSSGTVNSEFQVTLPPPSLPLTSIVSSPRTLPPVPRLQILPLPSPTAQEAGSLRRLSPARPIPSRPPSDSKSVGVSPARGRTLLPSSRRNTDNRKILLPPLKPHTRNNSKMSTRFTPATHNRKAVNMVTKPAKLKNSAGIVPANKALDLKPTLPPFKPSTPAMTVATTAAPAATAAKSRRVRTGCLTCRERHLKCDEGVPDCMNCMKRNRECKRGLRLNFIDIQSKPIPFIPPVTDWKGKIQPCMRHNCGVGQDRA